MIWQACHQVGELREELGDSKISIAVELQLNPAHLEKFPNLSNFF